MESLQDLCLVIQDLPIRLNPDLGQLLPPFEILLIPLISVGLFRVLPVTFAKVEHGGDFSVFDVVDQRAGGAGFFEPVALPELAGTDALVVCGLVVETARHGTAVDGVDDAVGGAEPHFVAPFFGFARGRVFRVVVVDEVKVFDVLGEGGFHRLVVAWPQHC